MMTYKTLITATLAAAALQGTAYAQGGQNQDSGAYGVIGMTAYDPDIWGLDAKLGYNFTKNFGVEAQGVWGLTSDSGPLSSAANAATLTEKVNYTIGAFAVARLPISERFDIFARAGIHSTQKNFKITNALGTDFNATDTGVAVGAGLQYNLGPKSGVRAEYTYLDNADAQTTFAGAETISIGYVRKF